MKRIDILIIDDEKKFADMLSRRIELRGSTTKICYDGRTAIEWIKKNHQQVRLILLDLQLPDIYGTTVLTRIKQINPQIPVVILTGHGTEQDQLNCEQLGAYKFVHKPLEIDALMEMLEQVREKSK